MTTATTAKSSTFAEPPAVRTAKRRARMLVRRAARSVRSRPAVPDWTLVSAGLSPILLVGAWLVADVRQPDTYSPVRQTISVLAGHAGSDRWIVTGAVFLVGACHLLTALGLTAVRSSARVLLTVAGVAAIGIAASPEPVHGSTPQHLAWTALGAVTIALWPAFVARRTPLRPPILSVRGSATTTAIFVGLLGWVLIETRGGNTLGLAERLTTTVQITWPFIVALAARRSSGTVHGVLDAPAELSRDLHWNGVGGPG
ncbi:MAG TPA: DUF998 domain-containing protein [Pseudonocardiaceae bacterium]|nr:DUF998 domain-containing protein [Pseudonocardiaceae bacterium]